MRVITFGDIVVDPKAARVSRDGRTVRLEPKAFAVLLSLLESPGVVLTHEQLLARAWPATFVTPNTLARAVAQLRRALGDNAKTPRYIETVHTRGYRFVASLSESDGRPATRPQRPTSARRVSMLPAPLAPLIGREAELERLREGLAVARLLTLTGPPGIGKTQLCLEAARQNAHRFTDGVSVVDFAPYAGEADVPRIVAAALDIVDGPSDGGDHTATVAAAIGDRRELLVLDNCEHVVDRCATLTQVLLRACAGLSILATSQRAMGVAGESVVVVPPLKVPPVGADLSLDNLATIAAIPAVQLLVSRARNVVPSFDLAMRATTVGAVADICRRLDGIPLAIELAAARMNVLSAEQLAARLEDRFALLTTGQRTLARHHTLQAAVDWSYTLLSPAARELLNRVSVFAGGWSLDAVESVCASDDLNGDATVNLLGSLVDSSLVIAEAEGEAYRYSLLETIRSYARAALRRSGRAEDVRAKHSEHFLGLVCRAAPALGGPDQAQWLDTLDRDQANLTAAWEWAVTAPDRGAQALQFAVALQPYWQCRSRFVEAREWLSKALELAPRARPTDRAAALVALAWIDYLGARPTAATRASDALAALPNDDQSLRAIALAILAGVDADPRHGDRSARKALRAATATSDHRTIGVVRLASGIRASRLRRHDEATRHFGRARRLLTPGGDRWLVKYATIYEGVERHLLGDHTRAAALLASGLAMATALRDRRAVAACLEAFGYIALRLRNSNLACRLLGAAESLREATGVPLAPPWTALNTSARRNLRRRLGRSAARVWQLGTRAPLDVLTDEAIAKLVLRAGPSRPRRHII